MTKWAAWITGFESSKSCVQFETVTAPDDVRNLISTSCPSALEGQDAGFFCGRRRSVRLLVLTTLSKRAICSFGTVPDLPSGSSDQVPSRLTVNVDEQVLPEAHNPPDRVTSIKTLVVAELGVDGSAAVGRVLRSFVQPPTITVPTIANTNQTYCSEGRCILILLSVLHADRD